MMRPRTVEFRLRLLARRSETATFFLCGWALIALAAALAPADECGSSGANSAGQEITGTDQGTPPGSSAQPGLGDWGHEDLDDQDDRRSVPLGDLSALFDCLTGPAASVAPACRQYDLNVDASIDLADFRVWQLLFDGNGRPWPGDWNDDGAVDQSDFAGFPGCATGPGGDLPVSCEPLDFDVDADVDLADFGALQRISGLCFGDGECDDGLFCNGAESCVEGACQPGQPPCDGLECDEASASCIQVGCITSSPTWQNFPIDPQATRFTVRLSAIPLQANMDGLTTLSQGESTAFADAAILLRFNQAGRIDARDGGVYNADAEIPYTPGLVYEFRLVIDISTHTYDIYVQPADENEQLLGLGYLFRGEQLDVTALDNWGTWAGEGLGSHDVCSLSVGPGPNAAPIVDAGPDQVVAWPTGTAELKATVTDDGLPDPPGAMETTWYATSGPGAVTFDDAHAIDTVAHFAAEGIYTLRLIASDGDLSSFDVITVRVQDPDTPQLVTDPVFLDFGATETVRTFEVWNDGLGALSYVITSDAPWLTVQPDNGQSSGEHDTIEAFVNRAGLTNGAYDAQLTVTPGAGQPVAMNVSMIVGPTGPVVTPIARWDVVPWQRIEPGEVFNCGIVAFSKPGIQRVSFSVNGGAPVDVNSMTYNARTDVVEYWIPISADGFATDGPISVEAVVYGNDGGSRTLPPLVLNVNPNGTLPRPEAWVDRATGNDISGQVNNVNAPFETVGQALESIRAWMSAHGHGSRADGGVVRLYPGDQVLDSAGYLYGVPTTGEWVTITHDPSLGGSRENTWIRGVDAASSTSSMLLKAEGLGLQSTLNNRPLFNFPSDDPDCTEKKLWLHDCTVVGYGRHESWPHIVGANYKNRYFTHCHISNVRFGQAFGSSLILARGLDMEHIGEDAYAATPLIINCTVSDVDPGLETGWHSDAWQSPGIHTTAPIRNYIVYNFKATNLHYQGLFGRSATLSTNNAFVNVFIEMRAPIRVGGGTDALMGEYDHLLMWHCTLIGTGHTPFFSLNSEPTTTGFRFSNSSFCASIWTDLRSNQGSDWTTAADVEFLHNHYIQGSMTPDSGSTKTVGSPGLVLDPDDPDFGHPAGPSSPLVDRVTPLLVPVDVDGRPRSWPADVGAFEY